MEYVSRYTFTTTSDELYESIEDRKACTFDELIQATIKKMNAELYGSRIISVQEYESTKEMGYGTSEASPGSHHLHHWSHAKPVTLHRCGWVYQTIRFLMV